MATQSKVQSRRVNHQTTIGGVTVTIVSEYADRIFYGFRNQQWYLVEEGDADWQYGIYIYEFVQLGERAARTMFTDICEGTR